MCETSAPMIPSSLSWPGFKDSKTSDTIVDCHVETERLGPGKINHRLVLEASTHECPLWTKEIVFRIDAPFEVPDLKNHDPFVIASLFPAMEVGGTLRVHGAVSRTMMRNILDYQCAWFLVAPNLFTPFTLEVAAIDDSRGKKISSRPNAVLAFTGGVDSMLALCRNASGDTGEIGCDIAATLMIRGMSVSPGNQEDPAELTEDLRRMSGRWDAPLAVVDTNIFEVIDKPRVTHGTWLAACLSLFSGAFDVGLIGSSKIWYSPGWEVFGSHPLLDPMLSSGQMTIRDDEGLFGRPEKVALLTRYPSAMEDLRVCFNARKGMRNCCRCEKCVRTMLCFIASGNAVPSAFPRQLRLQDIGTGMGNENGLKRGPPILECAKRFGTTGDPAIQTLRRRYRKKRLKLAAKKWLKRVITGQKPSRWVVLDNIEPIKHRPYSES